MKPSATLVDSPLMDKYDADEPEPEPIFFDTQGTTPKDTTDALVQPVKPVQPVQK